MPNGSLYFYLFTNIFSPNNDGVNDKLVVYAGKSIDKINLMNIYDRWGNLIYSAKDFEPNDPAFGWDGLYKGEILSYGVFVYRMEISFINAGFSYKKYF